MIRTASSILASTFLVACASVPNSDAHGGQALELQPQAAIVENDSTPDGAWTDDSVPSSPAVEFGVGSTDYEAILAAGPVDPSAPSAEIGDANEDLRTNRMTIKGGYYSTEDTDELGEGFIINLAWTQYINNWFGVEFEAGYIDSDGDDAGVDGEFWAIPMMVNGRLNVPLWIFDVYGGAGIGGFYYDMEIGAADDDGFLFGGNAFAGASVGIADSVALGLEAKYYMTDEISDLGDATLDAFAVMLTLGFSR